MPSLPLPENTCVIGEHRPAYDICLWLQDCDCWDETTAKNESDSEYIMWNVPPPTAARVLGYGLLYATNERGREALARDVLSCGRDQELLAGLTHLYVHGLIGVCAWLYSL